MAVEQAGAVDGWKARLTMPALWAAAAAGILVVQAAAWLLEAAAVHTEDAYTFQDTYYVVARGHPVISLAGAMAGFAVAYILLDLFEWPPRHPRLRLVQFLLTLIGALTILAPPLGLGVVGFPLRHEDLPVVFAFWNWMTSAGYALVLIGLVIFIFLALDAIGRRASPPP